MEYYSLNEMVERGTPHFPISFYNLSWCAQGPIFPYHWHTQWEIVFVKEGSCIVTVDGSKYPARQGDAFFLLSGQLHTAEAVPPDGCQLISVVFDCDMLIRTTDVCSQYVHWIETGEMIPLTHYSVVHPDHQDVTRAAEHLMQHMTRQNFGYELLVKASLYEFLGSVFSHRLYSQTRESPKSKKQQNINRLKIVMGMIQDHYKDGITLDMLANSVDMSVQHFCRFFKSMTGTSAMDYVNYYRISVACDLLQQGTLSKTEISLECGFNNLSYFIKTFRKYKGCSPSEYMRE
ncbi:MAG: AraC family transcriptional regulator [Eubacteriales bacterium]|nr:AraC family transcriptional regulator [Eubacteriales bacterium]